MGFIYYGARGNHIPFVLILWHARQWNRTHLEVTNIHPGWVGNSKVGWLSKSLIFQIRTFRNVANFKLNWHRKTNSLTTKNFKLATSKRHERFNSQPNFDWKQDLLCGTEPLGVEKILSSVLLFWHIKNTKKHHRPYLLASSSSFIVHHCSSSFIITDHHCSSHFSFT